MIPPGLLRRAQVNVTREPGRAGRELFRGLCRQAALGRCRWLERSNLAVAAATGVMYLEASGVSVKPSRQDAIALRDLLMDPACTASRIAAVLRTWPST